ncbi:SoxR reducing system RseC family protein [Clostridium botulinum C]|uniref:SoxR reducing system RseC family protein n=1 Tax=Clostridium botulinum TaxID=1491 RepID=UPI001E4C552E|nr:SoxR reducing system RseC family protein [Clostridium botulinum]MCD3217093.1 SoxR reducing system RseC family protein [Clostridium botulinum C]
MTEVGYITSVNGKYASVNFKRKSGCGDNCATCKAACKASAITTDIENTVGGKVGDKVKVEMEQKTFDRMVFLVYIFPLIMMICGIGIGTVIFSSAGYKNYEMLSFLLGIVALAISYVILHYFNKKNAKKNNYSLRIIEVIEEKPNK